MSDSKYKLKIVCAAMLQSWRVQGLGPTERYTELHPTKSGIIGMISCALGYERGDKRINELSEKLDLFLDNKESGQILSSKPCQLDTLIDFQVVRAPKIGMLTAGGSENSSGKASRLNEATLIYKEYIVNHRFVTYLVTDDKETLLKIEKALDAPVWQYYLGSKCCVPSEPVSQGITTTTEEELHDYQYI